MLFRNYIYLDEAFLEQLATQIDMSFDPADYTESETSSGSLEAGLKGVLKGADVSSTSRNMTIRKKYTATKKLVEFENTCMDSDSIITIGGESLATSLRQGELIMSTGQVIFPEMLGNLDALKQIEGLFGRDFALSQLNIESEDDIAQKLLPALFKDIERIPITLEDSGVCVVSEITKDALLISAEDFFDQAEVDVTVLGVITKVCPKGQSIEVYDFLKAIGLGRQIRRAFEADPKQNAHQYKEVVDYPAIQVKPIAVWQ